VLAQQRSTATGDIPPAVTRGRPPLFVAAALVAVVAVASLSASAQARPRLAARHHAGSERGCGAQFSGGPIVLANRQAGIILRKGNYEGCWFASRSRAVTLGTPYGPVPGDGLLQAQQLTLNGTMAAFFEASGNQQGSGYGITVVDLKRRRTIGTFATGQPSPTQSQLANFYGEGLDGVGPTTGLVVSPTGSVAWLVHDNQAPDPPTYQVWKADRGSAATMLAAGNDIDPSSLALGASTLHWAQGGASHASTLG